MSREIEIRFDSKEFQKQLDRMTGEEVGKVLAVGVYEGMTLVAAEARRTAPDSGVSPGSSRKSIKGQRHNWKLRDSIVVKEVKISARGILGRIVALPFYARFVERGVPSRGIKPNPFMRKSAASKRGAAVEAFRKSVGEAVAQAFR
jgi:HK97 gp10 family phage protein